MSSSKLKIQAVMQQSETIQSRIQSFAFVISIMVCIMFSIFFVFVSFMSFGSVHVGCKIELDEKINPNDSPVASLIRLPDVGLVRAKEIVAYRENFYEKNKESPPFRDCSDLQKVKGIGPKTAQNISQWLKFE